MTEPKTENILSDAPLVTLSCCCCCTHAHTHTLRLAAHHFPSSARPTAALGLGSLLLHTSLRARTGCGAFWVQLRPQCIRDQRSRRQPIRALVVEEGVVSLCADQGGSAKQAAPPPPPRPATAGSRSASSEPDGSTSGHFQSTGSPLLTQSGEP